MSSAARWPHFAGDEPPDAPRRRRGDGLRLLVAHRAQARAAGAHTAVGIALASLFLTPLLFHLPTAVLAATIIAVLSLVDLGALRRTWTFSRFDFAAMGGTIVVTLGWGVEAGIITGVAISVLLHLWRTSRPHVAVIGQIPDTQHFRNVLRHDVACAPEVLSLRIDESLFFANARTIEDVVQQAVASARRYATSCSTAPPSTASTQARWRASNSSCTVSKMQGSSSTSPR